MQVQTDVIYLNFSKAFDNLNHNILIRKLTNMGISKDLTHFFKSYLTDRKQFVAYNEFKSTEYISCSGVPQGSVLGSLHRIFNISDCVKLQNNISKLSAWCDENCLTLNVNKCNVMTFSSKDSNYTFNYSIDNEPLTRPSTFKDLGVTFDKKTELYQSHRYISM